FVAFVFFFFFQAEDGIRDFHVTGVQTCALPISRLPLHTLHQGHRRIARQGCQHLGEQLLVKDGQQGADYLTLLSFHWHGHLYKPAVIDRKSTRLNSSHVKISYAVFCLKKKNIHIENASCHKEFHSTRYYSRSHYDNADP